MPAFAREPRLVSLKHAAEYPFNDGRIVTPTASTSRRRRWRDVFEEFQVEGSNALHARLARRQGRLPAGARGARHARRRPAPPAGEGGARARRASRELIRTNIYASIVARAVELVHAFAEAIDIIDAYRPPAEPLVPWQSRAGRRGVGHGGAARPALPPLRGGRGRAASRRAQIVPPTSQNQAAIEADLVVAAKEVLDLPHEAATHRLEQMIRSYDPCISCATHFLDLTIEEA